MKKWFSRFIYHYLKIRYKHIFPINLFPFFPFRKMCYLRPAVDTLDKALPLFRKLRDVYKFHTNFSVPMHFKVNCIVFNILLFFFNFLGCLRFCYVK